MRSMGGTQKKMWMKVRWMRRMRARRWSRMKVRLGLMEGAWGRWD